MIMKNWLRYISRVLIVLLFVNTSCSVTRGSQTSDKKSEKEGCGENFSSLVLEDNGDILFETRSENIVYPASLVKVMTIYLVFEALKKGELSPNQILKVSARGQEISNVNKYTTLHLKEGDEITVKEAIRATIVKSFNGAAVTLSEAVAGNEWRFVRKMNEKAEELGMIRTSFRNSTGLHGEGQYTTTYDLARLVMAIRKDFPKYYHLFGLKEFTYKKVTYKTHNHILLEYEGAEGMKTGFTSMAGSNLIGIAKRKEKRVISVLLSCVNHKNRDQLTKELFDKAFVTLGKDNDKLSPMFKLAAH